MFIKDINFGTWLLYSSKSVFWGMRCSWWWRFKPEVFGAMTLFTVVVGHKHFRGPCCFYLHPEDGGSKGPRLWLKLVFINGDYY